MTTIRHLITGEQISLYQSLPGHAVTGAFLRQHGPVVMADAVSSLESLLPNYEVLNVQIEPTDGPLFAALIEYRSRVVVCDVCQKPFCGMPQWLHLPIGPRRPHCWCSDACQSALIDRALEEATRHRQEIGDLVEAGWQYLRLRQEVPSDIRCYMTSGEWEALRKRCNDVYTALRRNLASVFVARFGTGSKPEPTPARHSQQQATALDLWAELEQRS